jgi:hypothetical protein
MIVRTLIITLPWFHWIPWIPWVPWLPCLLWIPWLPWHPWHAWMLWSSTSTIIIHFWIQKSSRLQNSRKSDTLIRTDQLKRVLSNFSFNRVLSISACVCRYEYWVLVKAFFSQIILSLHSQPHHKFEVNFPWLMLIQKQGDYG